MCDIYGSRKTLQSASQKIIPALLLVKGTARAPYQYNAHANPKHWETCSLPRWQLFSYASISSPSRINLTWCGVCAFCILSIAFLLIRCHDTRPSTWICFMLFVVKRRAIAWRAAFGGDGSGEDWDVDRSVELERNVDGGSGTADSEEAKRYPAEVNE